MGQVLHGSATTTEAVRRAIMSREPEDARQALQRQSEDCRQAEVAEVRRRSPDRPEGAPINRPGR